MGTPEDVNGECNAHLYIGDDYGDSHATIRCQLPQGHTGPHQERYRHEPQRVTVEWTLDDKEPRKP